MQNWVNQQSGQPLRGTVQELRHQSLASKGFTVLLTLLVRTYWLPAGLRNQLHVFLPNVCEVITYENLVWIVKGSCSFQKAGQKNAESSCFRVRMKRETWKQTQTSCLCLQCKRKFKDVGQEWIIKRTQTQKWRVELSRTGCTKDEGWIRPLDAKGHKGTTWRQTRGRELQPRKRQI